MKYIIPFILLAILPSLAFGQKINILESYAKSYEKPIRIYAGDTVITYVNGYFINDIRSDFYDKLHRTVISDSLSSNDISLLLYDVDAFLERQEADINDLRFSYEEIKAQLRAIEKKLNDIKENPTVKYIEVPKVKIEKVRQPTWAYIAGAAGLTAIIISIFPLR